MRREAARGDGCDNRSKRERPAKFLFIKHELYNKVIYFKSTKMIINYC